MAFRGTGGFRPYFPAPFLPLRFGVGPFPFLSLGPLSGDSEATAATGSGSDPSLIRRPWRRPGSNGLFEEMSERGGAYENGAMGLQSKEK